MEERLLFPSPGLLHYSDHRPSFYYTRLLYLHTFFFFCQSMRCLYILGLLWVLTTSQRDEEDRYNYPHFMDVENKTQKMK